ncbi:MAG TPA: Rrf2 family transcriptional regulator [Bacteroidota bacterium]|nr:Rrf2 family transcriptional regulator [Bacteroidota bacterium]
MQLTMTGEYAIRTMVHLSRLEPGTIAQISDISKKWQIPEKFLRKIVARLCRAGLIRSHRGVHGGLSLARPPEQITLLQVVEQIEGPMALNRCLVDPDFCPRVTVCSVHDVWDETQGKLREFLSSRTFAELSRQKSEPFAGVAAEA